MPFTPFHFGPAFLIGILFMTHINMAAILLASVAIDIEPIYCLTTDSCTLHGVLHTYTGATLSTLFVIPIIYFAKRPLQRLSDVLGVRQNYSIKSIVVGALVGAWSHVFLDSFLYSDLLPFWPISNENPFVGLLNSDTVYLITIIGFVVGGAVYFWKLKNILKAEKAGSQQN
jgi:hypothetical protein